MSDFTLMNDFRILKEDYYSKIELFTVKLIISTIKAC